MKRDFKTEWNAADEAEREALTGELLRQKFDAELRQKWSAQLAEQGIQRQATAQPEAHIVSMVGRRRRWGWAAAAAVLALLATSIWLFLKPAAGQDEPLATQYFAEIASQATQTRMGENDADAAWQTAQDFYAQGNFDQAAKTVETLAATTALDAGQLYFLALCHLQTVPPAHDLALAKLEAARQVNRANQTGAFSEEIEWLAALALLQKGDEAAAAEKLRAIAGAEGWFAEKARALLVKAF